MISPPEATSSAPNSDISDPTPVESCDSRRSSTPDNSEASKSASVDELVTSTTNTSSTLDIDPSQLIFRLGLSPSPSKNDSWPNVMSSPPTAISSSVASTSTDRANNIPDLFGSYVRASASNTPRRFNFEASPTGAVSSSKTCPQARPSDAACSSKSYHAPIQPPPIIPNLGPDVTIRPVMTKKVNLNKFEASSSTKKNLQQKPALDSNEIFKLMSGYNHLNSEVASLKTQLAEKESLIHEILGNFSSEVAKLNGRLIAVEKELRKTKKRDNMDAQEDITEQLDDLSLTKKDVSG